MDGIYFNTSQDFNLQNKNIKRTYLESDAVIFQSRFNRDLTESWFGQHKNGCIISNGPDIDLVSRVEKANLKETFGNREIWISASSWRPHKRLRDNIRYFLKYSENEAIFLIAGKGARKEDFSGFENLINKRIFYLGHVSRETLISLCKASTTMVHLAYLDHCPNVVVDASAAGCTIVCSSSGGTKEIEAVNKIIVIEKDWDYSPVDLYNPPELSFDSTIMQKKDNLDYDLNKSTFLYYEVMKGIV